MRTRYAGLAGALIWIALMGCSRRQAGQVAVAAPTATPRPAPVETPTLQSPPVQFGPPPGGVKPAPPPSNFGPRPLVLPPSAAALAERKVPYFVHLREAVGVFNGTLQPIDAATNLKPADMRRAEVAVEAFRRKAAEAPAVPAECRKVNERVVAAADELSQVMNALRQAKPTSLEQFDQVAAHLEIARAQMEEALAQSEEVAVKWTG